MVSVNRIRKMVFDNKLIDRTFYTSKEFIEQDMFTMLSKVKAKEIRYHVNVRSWKSINVNDVRQFFNNKKILSGGTVAITHGSPGKYKKRFTQYFVGLIVKFAEKNIKTVDFEFLVYFKKDLKPKNINS